MKGFMKTRSALNQFLVLLCVTVVSFFVISGIGGLLVSVITGISLAEAVDISKLDFAKQSTIDFFRGMQVVQFFSLFLVPTLICLWLFSTNDKKYLGLKAPSDNGYIIAGVGVMLIAIPFTALLGELNQQIPFPENIANWMKQKEEAASKPMQALLSRPGVKDLLLNMVFIAICAGVGEELLFRGMVQRMLIRIFKSPWAGIVVSAAIFSAMHMQFYGFLPRFTLGILLGAIYWYSGSLWVAILAHFIYDAVLVLLAWSNPGMLKQDTDIPLTSLALGGSISLALVLILLVWMKKRSTASLQTVYADDTVPPKNHPFDFEHNTPE